MVPSNSLWPGGRKLPGLNPMAMDSSAKPGSFPSRTVLPHWRLPLHCDETTRANAIADFQTIKFTVSMLPGWTAITGTAAAPSRLIGAMQNAIEPCFHPIYRAGPDAARLNRELEDAPSPQPAEQRPKWCEKHGLRVYVLASIIVSARSGPCALEKNPR